MKRPESRFRRQSRRLGPAVVESLEGRQLLSQLTVTTAADSGPGSLRQAILDANATRTRDNIVFAIPGDGPHTIQPLTELPEIVSPVSINGYTQPGARPNTTKIRTNAQLRIELDGSMLDESSSLYGAGLRVKASNTVIRGLVINRFAGSGVFIDGRGSRTIVAGSFIGTDVSGTVELGNGGGVFAQADGVRIGGRNRDARNLISGNEFGGVFLLGHSHNRVEGNLIGTDASGTQDLGNEVAGVFLGSTEYTVVGGSLPGAGNVISGNDYGISLVEESVSTVPFRNAIRGNLIGTDASGRSVLGNEFSGIEISGPRTRRVVIGGAQPLARNVISGNGEHGIILQDGAGYHVIGNLIGTDRTERRDLGNGGSGIFVSYSKAVEIGGESPAEGNVIAFNGSCGVFNPTKNALIRSNRFFANKGGAVCRS